MAKTVCGVVINQTHGLHMGIADSGTKKLKAALFHIFTDRI
jgi:hypothetical protein